VIYKYANQRKEVKKMCCGPMGWRWGGHRSFCAFCCPWPFSFLTREEELAWLERYLEGLRSEVEGVEKRIAELKGEE